MPTAEEFDEFYVSTRRDLILQTFALTGDLAASRTAVRDSYVAARHHWDKVGKTEGPLGWVRPRAWSRAQRRHSISPWHRERHIDADQTATLEALHQLKDNQRRTLVLTQLTDLPLEQVAREIGLPVLRIQEHRDNATTIVTEALGCAPEEIADRLEALGAAVDTVKLPRPTIVRRNGLRRRRNFAVAGSVAIAAVLVSAGGFVAVGSPQDPATRAQAREAVKTTRSALLTEAQVAALAPGQTWDKPTTSQNDDQNASGKNTTCQQERYADKAADGALVRIFGTTTNPRRTLVQSVEISRSAVEAEAAYATTRSWYAGCQAARVQLVDSYDVAQVGNQAQVLLLEGTKKSDPSYAVGLARTGKLTTSVVLEVTAKSQVPVAAITTALATSVRNLCTLDTAGACVGKVARTASRPPPTGDTPGMIAAVDLPPVADVKESWFAAPLESGARNNAATICDKADFAKSGAVGPTGRGFIFREEKAAELFGVTETIGRFPSVKAADKFLNQVASKMKSCEDRVLSSTISTDVVRDGSKTPYAYWRLVNQTQNRKEVAYWMGISRVGPYVAQVTMFPVGKYDVSDKTFSALVLRSRDRLYEVQ